MPDATEDPKLLPGLSFETQVLVSLTEIKSELKPVTQAVTDHETRIRDIESVRLRALEDRRTISPGQLWGGLLGVATLGSGIAAMIALFLR